MGNGNKISVTIQRGNAASVLGSSDLADSCLYPGDPVLGISIASTKRLYALVEEC